jgi:hypothetical protein
MTNKINIETEQVWPSWASFLWNKEIPETEKYFVLATWTDDRDQAHSCRYPVRAVSRESAVLCVEQFESRRENGSLFADAVGGVEFEVALVHDLPKIQLDHLIRTRGVM